jgi:uncharacterized protein YegJ (DUF2314 family)
MLVAGCKSKQSAGPFGSASVARAGLVEAGAPVPAGDLHALHFRYALAVFSTSGAKKVDADAIVRASVEGKGIDVRTEIPKEPTDQRLLIIQHPSVREYAPPSTHDLQYFARGLSDEQKAMLPQATDVTVLLLGGPAADAVATYPVAAEAAAALTRATGGAIYDDETRQAYGVGAWEKALEGWKDGGADVPRTTIIHEYRDGELLRLVTLGMAKYGLPDVSVNQVAAHDSNSMGTLINLVCQTLVEHGVVDTPGSLPVSIAAVRNARGRASIGGDLRDGATGQATVALAEAKRESGDADNRLVEITFPGPENSLQERHNAMLSAIFGSHDSVAMVEDDALIQTASRRAKQVVLAYKPRYAHGAPPLEHLLVKGPFHRAHGGIEWMWVEVLRWEGSTIHGVLENDPDDVPELKAGARVDVREESIFDYIRVDVDGGKEGNETGRLIEAQQR